MMVIAFSIDINLKLTIVVISSCPKKLKILSFFNENFSKRNYLYKIKSLNSH